MRLACCAAAAVIALLSSPSGHAQAVSTGCPQFHCTPGATSVMDQSIISEPGAAAIPVPTKFGELQGQGCSGNGAVIACVYPGLAERARLKVLSAGLTSTLWTSTKPGIGINAGQVPFFFSNGDIGVGDTNKYYRFTGAGAPVLPALTLPTPGGSNVGLTDVGNGRGVISQANGNLTLVDMASLQVLDTLLLTTTANEEISFQSPPAGADGVLYVIARVQRNESHLFAVSVQPTANGWELVRRIDMALTGNSGASPVVTKDIGYAGNIVLLPTKSGTVNSLLALKDDLAASAFGTHWTRSLESNLVVTPVVDEAAQRVYYQYSRFDANPSIVGVNLHDGDSPTIYNIKTLFSRASDLVLAGHLSAISDGIHPFTILVAGNEGGTAAVFAVQPNGPIPARWQKTIPQAGGYGAWNLLPSTITGVYCPTLTLLGGTNNGVIKVCN